MIKVDILYYHYLLEPKNIGSCFANDFIVIKPTDERVTQFSDIIL